jgi:hypothetical protein
MHRPKAALFAVFVCLTPVVFAYPSITYPTKSSP